MLKSNTESDCPSSLDEIAQESGETVESTLFTDLGPILAGDLEPERPTVGEIDEGAGHLVYQGRLNEFHAEPGIGKTNVALGVSARILGEGGTVVFVDPEDTPQSVVGKLIRFGAKPDAIVSRFKYLHNPEPADLLRAVKWVGNNPPTLAIVDGLAELMAAAGASENDASDVLGFFRAYLRPFADAGAAVIVSDHVTKDSETRGRWARGSGAKMGRYDGAVYSIRSGAPYGPGRAGFVRLVLAKDRNGGVGAIGSTVAEVHFEPAGEKTAVAIIPATEKDFKPTALMEKVSKALEADPNASTRTLRALGKSQYVDQAISALQENGNLLVESGGAGKATKYHLREPYREA